MEVSRMHQNLVLSKSGEYMAGALKQRNKSEVKAMPTRSADSTSKLVE